MLVVFVVWLMVAGIVGNERPVDKSNEGQAKKASDGVINWLSYADVLERVEVHTGSTPADIAEIEARLLRLATRTRPPVWGYTGMLLDLVYRDEINDMDDIEKTVSKWEEYPVAANACFNDWDADRLAK